MVRWYADHHEVQVETQSERFIAKKLILCAGPWADQALLEYRLPLKVLHKHLYWYRCENPLYQQVKGFPCFFFDTPTGYYYGFPAFDESGLKVARHSGGTPVAIRGNTRAGSLDGTHHREEEDQRYVEDFLRMYMPSVIPTSNAPSQPSRWKGCYYTMTPDEHFIVDVLPDHDNVFVIAGLSGHGFKFTSVLGELASQFVMEKPIGFDLDFLKMSRFQKASTQ
jgi:glycine/D-amino acid oxidase-like deaminating enzyme